MSGTLLKSMVGKYVRSFAEHDSASHKEEELQQIEKAVMKQILDDSLLLIEEKTLEEGQEKVRREIADYKRAMMRRLRISLIVETIFLAFVVGIVVNQVTELIPGGWMTRVFVILLAAVVSIFLVLLMTAVEEE